MLPVPAPAHATSNTCAENRTHAVLVVDDDARVRRLLKAILLHGFPAMRFGEAGSVDEMFERLAERGWDALLLDVVMPGRSGLEALAELRDTYPKMPVLIVSMHSDYAYASAARALGAAGLVRKDSAPVDLVPAIAAMLRPGIPVSPAAADRGRTSPQRYYPIS